MKAKVPKCFSLAIAASPGKRYDPALHLSGLHTHHQIPGWPNLCTSDQQGPEEPSRGEAAAATTEDGRSSSDKEA